MNPMTRRSALAAGAALAVVASSDADASASDPPAVDVSTEEIVAAHEWLEEHRGNLPSEYDEIDSLSRMRRHLALDALPPDTASALVRERIRRCAEADREMTDEQRETIASTVETLSAAWYTTPPPEREKTRQQAFWPRTRATFTWSEWGRIFGEVGHESAVDLAPYESRPSDCAALVGW